MFSGTVTPEKGDDPMKQLKTMRRGFTLLEMIIVIGIIAILTAVFVPAISGYVTRSRVNTANADAKVIYNSMQTICQEFEFAERGAEDTIFYGPIHPDATVTSLAGFAGCELEIANSEIDLFVVNGHIEQVYIDNSYDYSTGGGHDWLTASVALGGNVNPSTLKWNIIDRLDDSSTTTQPMQRMERLFPDNDNCSYFIKIEGYQVKGVICASSTDTNYLGGFPLKAESRGGFAAKTGSLSNAPFNADEEWSLGSMGGDHFEFHEAIDYYCSHLN